MTAADVLQCRKAFRHVVLFAIAMTIIAPSALAHDFFPPPWRGAFRSTQAEWEFLTPSTGYPDGPLPVVVGDGGGDPWMTPSGGVEWDPAFLGSWVGTNGGWLNFYVPNWIDNEPWKDLWIQITYQPNPQQPPPMVSDLVGSPAGPVERLAEFTLPYDPTNNIWHRTEIWRMWPNPDWETFSIYVGPDVVVTQVVVDTWSVPEPSTFCLAGFGLALVAVRVWRRRK